MIIKGLILHGCALFLLAGCSGQQKKQDTLVPAGSGLSFEEKQANSALREEPYRAPFQPGQLNFRYAARLATPAVVHIKSVFPAKAEPEIPDLFRDFFDNDFLHRQAPPRESTPQVRIGSASGVIISADGYIVTNNHVVEGADSIEVILSNERSFRASRIGTDPATDLALLKIEAKDLPFIRFGNSDSIEVGDFVLAVGNPFNLASTVTAGIVSAKARNIHILTDKYAVESFIQTDAAVNPGNSGGALVDVNGQLVGINAAIATPTGAYAGYSFAIPVEIVKKVMNDLLQHGHVLRATLGVVISDLNGDRARSLGMSGLTGVLVDSLLENSAAREAGIRPGDVVVKADGQPMSSSNQLTEAIAIRHPGEKIKLTVLRDGAQKEILVTLRALPQEALAARPQRDLLKILGVEVSDLSARDKKELGLEVGVKVTGIGPGKIQNNTNMQEGFVIIKVNGRAVKDTREFLSLLGSLQGGVMLEGVYPHIPGSYYYAFGL